MLRAIPGIHIWGVEGRTIKTLWVVGVKSNKIVWVMGKK